MGPSPLTLERCFFSKVAIESTLAKETLPPACIKTRIMTLKAPEDPFRFQVHLTVNLTQNSEKPPGYHGALEVVGLFRIAESISEEKRESTIAINGATLLFGMAREMICTVTARGPWGMFVLPIVSFAGLKPSHKEVSVSPEENEGDRPAATTTET